MNEREKVCVAVWVGAGARGGVAQTKSGSAEQPCVT